MITKAARNPIMHIILYKIEQKTQWSLAAGMNANIFLLKIKYSIKKEGKCKTI
jgi:hypothetical protein